MTRSYYRLLHCVPDGGEEYWGMFDDDKKAIKALNAIFKKYKREHELSEKEFRKRFLAKHPEYLNHPKRQLDSWWWIIQRLGYIKPNVTIKDFDLPWKTIFTCQRGRD